MLAILYQFHNAALSHVSGHDLEQTSPLLSQTSFGGPTVRLVIGFNYLDFFENCHNVPWSFANFTSRSITPGINLSSSVAEALKGFPSCVDSKTAAIVLSKTSITSLLSPPSFIVGLMMDLAARRKLLL